jgi:hypothetical protein
LRTEFANRVIELAAAFEAGGDLDLRLPRITQPGRHAVMDPPRVEVPVALWADLGFTLIERIAQQVVTDGTHVFVAGLSLLGR